MYKQIVPLMIFLALGMPIVSEAEQICRSESEIPSSTPVNRFTDNGDGTVTDARTGLMWAKCREGISGPNCETVAENLRPSWEEALNIAGASELAGYTEWRLPNIKELASIIEQRCTQPAINLAVFPNTPASRFHTSSLQMASVYVWIVDFNEGLTGKSTAPGQEWVRLVRNAQ